MKQTIDISPEKIQPIAAAGVRFLNLETTLIPGNLKNQLAVLEVLLSGLSAGELLLAPPPPLPVESGDKEPAKDPEEGRKTRVPLPPTPEDIRELRELGRSQTGAGDKEPENG